MSGQQDNFQKLAMKARSLGATSFGVADLDVMKKDGLSAPAEECMSFRYGVSVGFRLSDALMETIKDGPTTTYRYHYRQVNAHLDRIGLELTAEIQTAGYEAMPIGASHILDWDNNTGHLSHKWIAYYAGLGWFGRNNLLINPEFGSRMRYVTVLTDMPLTAGKPVEGNCGDCTDCIDACPASAIGKTREDFRLDLCRKQLEVFKKEWNIGQQICGVCIKACRGPERKKNG